MEKNIQRIVVGDTVVALRNGRLNHVEYGEGNYPDVCVCNECTGEVEKRPKIRLDKKEQAKVVHRLAKELHEAIFEAENMGLTVEVRPTYGKKGSPKFSHVIGEYIPF
ncbi:hypothetical protein [uncultured Rikenella sp.]|uniref:hypothetical protein n=1 Tax=uncultured Rikenella sp. TaxID=368003 RepID=UPI0026389397|nr:hypothetical protein [uncultured Rikenella sp.]